MRYVAGFAFDSTLGNVALIQKLKGPHGMAGKWNGIGGKIEGTETPRSAMSREFQEEAGLYIPAADWSCFHTERFCATGDIVYFMTARTMSFHLIATQEAERVAAFDAQHI